MDKKRQIYIIGGVAAFALVGILVYVFMSRGSGDDTGSATPPPIQQSARGNKNPMNETGVPDAAGAPGGPGRPSAPDMGGPGMGTPSPAQPANPNAVASPNGTPAPGAASIGAPHPPPATLHEVRRGVGTPNKDPFFVSWHVPPPPPYIFDQTTGVMPIRLAPPPNEEPKPKDLEIREVANRRVSGILSGEGVFAIIDNGNNDSEIVKPGSVTKDGYRVVSINKDSVKLQKKQDNVTLTQVVPLSDVPPGSVPTSGFNPAGAGSSGSFGSGARGPINAGSSGGLGQGAGRPRGE